MRGVWGRREEGREGREGREVREGEERGGKESEGNGRGEKGWEEEERE